MLTVEQQDYLSLAHSCKTRCKN